MRFCPFPAGAFDCGEYAFAQDWKMKNATKHADELKSLLKKLMKEEKPEPMESLDPLQALVRGGMSFDVSDAKAEDAMKAINREFVDLNELRVATDLEIQEMLGQRYPAIEKRVAMITLSLNYIFEKEHTLSLDRLKTISKKDARTFLRALPEIHPFVEAYVMLFAFDGSAVPIDDEILKYLIEQEIVEEGTSLEDAQKFVEHSIKAEDAYDTYMCLRRASSGKKKK
jgi:endonuclease III